MFEKLKVECLRATSSLERVQRHFRQKARQMTIFHSEKGADASTQLIINRRGLALHSTESWVQLVEVALLVA